MVSFKDAEKLYEKVSADEDLRDQFAELDTEKEVVSKAMELGEELGLEVTADDLKALLEQNKRSMGSLMKPSWKQWPAELNQAAAIRRKWVYGIYVTKSDRRGFRFVCLDL